MTVQTSPETRRRTARPKTAKELQHDYPISVVIPFHDAAEHLTATLDALSLNDLDQTEILLVDDDSRDGSARLAESHQLSGRSRLIQLPVRSGPAAARNRGLLEALHPYVLFLDSDILLPEKSLFWIRETLEIYRHRPEVRGVLGVYATSLPSQDFFTNYKNLYTRFLYDTTQTLSPFVHTPIFCIHKETLENVGGFDGRLETAEDFRLGIALGSQGFRFVIDRRIQGVHLKIYSMGSILREDRRRIADLRRVQLAPGEREFYYRAHRFSRLLSVLLPGLTLISFVLSIWSAKFLWPSVFFLGLFFALNLKFLNFCRKKRGWWFALRAAFFLALEMAWASWVGLVSTLRYNRLPPEQSEGAQI